MTEAGWVERWGQTPTAWWVQQRTGVGNRGQKTDRLLGGGVAVGVQRQGVALGGNERGKAGLGFFLQHVI